MALFTRKKTTSPTEPSLVVSSAHSGACRPGSSVGVAVVLDQGHMTLHSYPDPRGGLRHAAWADLPVSAGEALASYPAEPPSVWPAPLRTDGETTWDGTLNEFPACNRVRLPDGTVAGWRKDNLGVSAAIVDPTGTYGPLDLATHLARACGRSILDRDGFEWRWLHENLRTIGIQAPAGEPVESLRAGLAHLLGYRNVATFTQDPFYAPTPIVHGGSPLWRRALPADRAALMPLARAVMSHDVTGKFNPTVQAGPVDVVRSGALLSQRLRRAAGVPRGIGKSEDADEKAGLSRFVWFHAAPWWPQVPDVFVWTDVMALLGWCGTLVFRHDPIWFPVPFQSEIRSDWKDLVVTDLIEIAALVRDGYVPQVAVPGAVPLTGVTAPTAMVVNSPWAQQQTADAFRALGMETLGGRPLLDAIRVDPMYVDLVAA